MIQQQPQQNSPTGQAEYSTIYETVIVRNSIFEHNLLLSVKYKKDVAGNVTKAFVKLEQEGYGLDFLKYDESFDVVMSLVGSEVHFSIAFQTRNSNFETVNMPILTFPIPVPVKYGKSRITGTLYTRGKAKFVLETFLIK